MKSLDDVLSVKDAKANNVASQFSNLSLTPSPAVGIAPRISNQLSDMSLLLESPVIGLTPKEPRGSIGLNLKEPRGSIGLTLKEPRGSTQSVSGIESQLSNVSDCRIMKAFSNLSNCSNSSGC